MRSSGEKFFFAFFPIIFSHIEGEIPPSGLLQAMFWLENFSPFLIESFATIDFLTIFLFFNSDLVGIFFQYLK